MTADPARVRLARFHFPLDRGRDGGKGAPACRRDPLGRRRGPAQRFPTATARERLLWLFPDKH